MYICSTNPDGMILTLTEIQTKFDNPTKAIGNNKVYDLSNRNKTLKEEHAYLMMHVHGIGLTDYLTKISGLENDEQILLRRKYSRSNKALWSDVLRLVDKIFSARGTIRNYDIKSDTLKKDFISKLEKLSNGYSLNKFIKTFWLDKLVVDPNGLFLVENKDGEAWPTYKSISTIRDYKVIGQKPEYVIFEPYKVMEEGKESEYVRVYDDAYDYLFKLENNKLIQVQDQTYVNPWGYVPAMVVSDIINSVNSDFKRSVIDEQCELADEYLRDNSALSIMKFLHEYPIFWMYLFACENCKGTKIVDGKQCPSCGGTGYSMKKDISKVYGIKPPTDREQPIITPNIAGYISPDKTSFDLINVELDKLSKMIKASHWGSTLEQIDNETATGKYIDSLPVSDRLNKYDDSVELCETILTNYLGEFYYGNVIYKGCSIHYSRNHIIESPEQLLNKYMEAKSKGSNIEVLDYLLNRYFESEYQNDALMLGYSKRLIEFEPYPHNTIEEVKGFAEGTQEFKRKLYFDKFKLTKTKEEIINPALTLEKFNSELDTFILKQYETKEVQ